MKTKVLLINLKLALRKEGLYASMPETTILVALYLQFMQSLPILEDISPSTPKGLGFF